MKPETRQPGYRPRGPITWKKIILDMKFRSEGVAVADVNKDGQVDIVVGDIWYEAPDWKDARHSPGPRASIRSARANASAASSTTSTATAGRT